MASQTPVFGLNKPALSDAPNIIDAVSDNMDKIDAKAVINLRDDAAKKTEIVNEPGGGGASIQSESKVTDAAAVLETNVPESGADFTEGGAGAAPSGTYAGGRVKTADGTATARFALTPEGLKEQLPGQKFKLVRTSRQIAVLPASAWQADGTAICPCPGMRANMEQKDFDVEGASASQYPIECSAGLGDTDIVPLDGAFKLTAIGVVPTVELQFIVTIYGREG
jgi:hypothetical protein